VPKKSLSDYEFNERFYTDKLISHLPNIESVEYTSGRIAYDAIITLKNQKKILTEVKVRDCYISTYSDYIIQVDKVINLIKYKVKGNYEFVYYINYFKNAENSNSIDCIVFNLGKRLLEWKTNPPKIHLMWMPNETYKSRSYKVQKEVVLLNYDETKDMKCNFSLN
jgi:hypothetical protein